MERFTLGIWDDIKLALLGRRLWLRYQLITFFFIQSGDEDWLERKEKAHAKAKRLTEFVSFFTQLAFANLAAHFFLTASQKALHSGDTLGGIALCFCWVQALAIYCVLVIRIMSVISTYWLRDILQSFNGPVFKYLVLGYAIFQTLAAGYGINCLVTAILETSPLSK